MINSHANELAAAARHWASPSLQRWWSEYAFFPKRLCRIHWEKGNDLFAFFFFICKTRVAEHSHLLSDGGLLHASYSSTVAASICRLDHLLHRKYLVLCSSQMRHSQIEKEGQDLPKPIRAQAFSTGLLSDPWFVAHGLHGSWSRHFENPLLLSLTIY